MSSLESKTFLSSFGRKRIARRRFTGSLLTAGGMILASRGNAAEWKLRQFHNQPAQSSLHKRLVELWAAVSSETGGRLDVQTFAENDHIKGGDPAAFQMLLRGELDFFTLNGGVIGSLVPVMNVQNVPFSFTSPSQVYEALDGDLGEYLRKEMASRGKKRGSTAYRHGCSKMDFTRSPAPHGRFKQRWISKE